jgi:hypothetical protein
MNKNSSFVCVQGKCQRKEPPCKYLHPPQHLREQLLQNGRNNLILKSLQLQAIQGSQILPTGIIQMVSHIVVGLFVYLSVYVDMDR